MLDQLLDRTRYDKQKAEERAKLPLLLQDWLDDLTAFHQANVDVLMAQKPIDLAPLSAELATVQAKREKLSGELKAAREQLANIPEEAEPATVAAWITVSDRWQERVNVATAEAAEVQQKIRAIDSQYSSAAHHEQVEMDLIFQDATRRLPGFRPILTA